MATKKYRRWLIAVMIGWLPISGVMASTMLIYAAVANSHGEGDATPLDGELRALPCHQAIADESLDDSTCSHCALCHIAGAVMPPALLNAPITLHHDCPQSISSDAFVSFIPDLPRRPPSASRA